MSILARASIVSAATLASRVLGFARDAGTAAVLGAGPLADALLAALSLPLLARRLLAEGAVNAALIPTLVAGARSGVPDGARRVATGALVLLVAALAAAAGLGAVFMPALVSVLAPGFAADGERAALAVECGRIALLYLPLAGAAAVFGAVANAGGRVLLPALGPLTANLVVLATILVLVAEGVLESPAAALAVAAATVGSGLAQLALMAAAAAGAPAAPRLGAGLPAMDTPNHAAEARNPPPLGGGSDSSAGRKPARFRLSRWGSGADWAGARAVLRASAPALLFAGLSQLRLLVVAAVVSSLPGALAALNYAYRLIDLPLGLVGASAGAVLVPALAAAGGAGARREATAATLAALALALPAGTGLAMLAEPIVTVLYQRGGFDAADAARTAGLLLILAASLPFQGVERILSATALTHGHTRMAERIGLASLLGCLALAAGLGWAFGPAGAAAAVALSALASAAAMAVGLARAGHLAPDRRFAAASGALIAACALMAAMVGGAAALWPEAGGLEGAVRLAALVALGVAVYASAAFGLGRLAARGHNGIDREGETP